MKLIFGTAVTAIVFLVLFSFFTLNQRHVDKAYTVQLCRAKVMAKYEQTWDNCCYQSNQSANCKQKLSCEPSWDGYAKQMKAC